MKLRIHSADGVHADAFSLASYSEGFGCRWRLFSSASLFKLVLKCCLTVQIIMYLFGWTAPLMIWPFNVLFGVLETNFSQSHFQYQTLFNHLASSNLRIIRTQEKLNFWAGGTFQKSATESDPLVVLCSPSYETLWLASVHFTLRCPFQIPGKSIWIHNSLFMWGLTKELEHSGELR